MNHGWEYKQLGDICNIYQSKTISTKELVENGDFNVFGANGVIGKYHSYNHEEAEVLLTCRGASCGTINVSTPKSWINGNAMVIHPKTNDIKKSYLRVALKSIDYSTIITGAAQPQITRVSLSPVSIAIPSKEEQNHIVSELDKINELIEVKRSQLADLDLLAQSLFYEMFGDPIENPKGWNLYNLGDCVEFKNGLNFTPSDNGNEIKCLGVGNFKSNRYISDESLHSINIVELVSKEYLLEDGDIVFVRSNGNKALIGRSVLYTSKGAEVTFSGFCIRCRYSKEKYNPLYMAYLLSSKTIRHYITSQGKGCNISNINQKILSAMPFIVPPIELQHQFAAKIKMIEVQKRRIDSSLIDLQTLLASRTDYWFND